MLQRSEEFSERFRGIQYSLFCCRELGRKDCEENGHGNRRHRIVRGKSSELGVIVLRCLKFDLELC